MIHVLLATGQRVSLTDGEARALFDELWLLGGSVGAISAAGLIEHERRRFVEPHPVRLDVRQSAAFRRALASLHRAAAVL
jgi:hypothetical protein